MTEHTPGPWFREGRTIYALNEQGTNRMFVHVQRALAHTGDEAEQEANACLIHAAPKLLKALEAIAQLQRDKCENAGAETLFMLLDNKVEIARAAIAKTTGAKVTA